MIRHNIGHPSDDGLDASVGDNVANIMLVVMSDVYVAKNLIKLQLRAITFFT